MNDFTPYKVRALCHSCGEEYDAITHNANTRMVMSQAEELIHFGTCDTCVEIASQELARITRSTVTTPKDIHITEVAEPEIVEDEDDPFGRHPGASFD